MGAALYLGLRADPQLVKLEDPGSEDRAKRGSVRWTLGRVKSLSMKPARGMTYYEAAFEVMRSIQRPLDHPGDHGPGDEKGTNHPERQDTTN